MNKKTLFLAGLMIAGAMSAQVGRVGINTENPKATLHVASKGPANQVQGITFPHGDQTQIDSWGASMGADNVGTIVYNTNQGCLEMWAQKDNTPTFGWVSLCGGARRTTPITPVPPGTPTPPSPILPPATASTSEIPTGMVVTNGGLYLASIYDTDYLPYTGDQSGTAVGKVGPHNADGSTLPNGREPVIDYQKTIDHTGMMVGLPVSSVIGGTINIPSTGLVFYATVPAALTSDQTKDIEMELIFEYSKNAGISTGTRKYLLGTLRTKNNGEILKPIKLDMNVGNGSSGKGVPLAEFVIPHQDTSTAPVKFYLNAVTGVPDKYFDVPQDAASEAKVIGKYLNHFVYVPMYGWDGNVWLSKNLGAIDASLDNIGGTVLPKNQNSTLKLGEFGTDHKSLGGLYKRFETSDGTGVGYWISDYGFSIYTKIARSFYVGMPSGFGPVANHCPIGYGIPSLSLMSDFGKKHFGSVYELPTYNGENFVFYSGTGNFVGNNSEHYLVKETGVYSRNRNPNDSGVMKTDFLSMHVGNTTHIRCIKQ